MTKNNEAREQVMQRIRDAFATDFPEVRGRVMRLNVGPPMDYPVVFRVFGEDPTLLRHIADRVADIVRANPHTVDVNDDWHERIPSFSLALDQDKARARSLNVKPLASVTSSLHGNPRRAVPRG